MKQLHVTTRYKKRNFQWEMQNIVFSTFTAPSCLNTSIDNLVIKVSPYLHTYIVGNWQKRYKLKKKKKPYKLGSEFKRLRGKSDFEQFWWNIPRTSLGIFDVLLAVCFLLFRSLPHILRGKFRKGNSTRQKQATDIAFFLFIVKLFTFLLLAFRQKLSQDSVKMSNSNVGKIFLWNSIRVPKRRSIWKTYHLKSTLSM